MSTTAGLRLRDIASQEVLTVTVETPLAQVIRLFAERRVSSVVVVEERKPVGIVTERDLLRLICVGYADTKPVRSVMSAALRTARLDMDFASAHLLMVHYAIRHLVLVDEAGDLCGIVSETDFRRHIGHDLFAAIQHLSAIMDPTLELIAPDSSLAYALETMASRQLDHLLIGRDGLPLGILTERDVPRLMVAHLAPESVRVGEVMSQPVRCIPLDLPVGEAARLMEEHRLRHLVVMGPDGRVAGTFSQHRMLERLSSLLLAEGHARLSTQLNLALETTGVGVWQLDHRHHTFTRSPALGALLGQRHLAATEALIDFLACLVPQDRERMAEAFEGRTAAYAQGFEAECRVQGASAQPRWLNFRGRVVEHGRDGEPLRSAGVAVDIHAQKEAEASFSRSQSRLFTLMSKVPIPLCHVNAHGEIVHCNQRFTEVFGYQRSDIPTLDDWWIKAYPDPAYRAWVQTHWERVVGAAESSGAAIQPEDYRVTCANGEERIIEVSGIALDDEFLATFIEVTEQRTQQRLLEFSNAILGKVSIRTPQPETLNFICQQIEAQFKGVRCAVMLLDALAQTLQTGAAPSLPEAYSAAIQGVRIGPSTGSCGTAAYLGEAVLATDIASDPLWADYRSLAQTHGLAACWSSPIKSPEGHVLGTFAIYWRQPLRNQVDPLLRRYIESATGLAAITIESERNRGQLQHQLDELRRWQRVMLGREGRVLELKQEVNTLLARLNEPARYGALGPAGQVSGG